MEATGTLGKLVSHQCELVVPMSSSSESLFARAQQLIPGGVNSPVRAFRSVGGAPFFTKSAQGATLTTVDGRELIDFVCTWGPAIHGHNHPRIKAAIATALESGTSFGTPNPYEVRMAELIVSFFPSIQKVRMCSSGTEATMSAIRLARGFTKRDKIIKFAGCYHGHSDSLLIKAGSGALTHGGVQELEKITPDLTCLGKIIGGGLPVGAFGGRADIMDLLAPLGPVYQAGTLSGNPLALAAGIAQLELL